MTRANLFSVAIADWREHADEIRAIRHRVFVLEQGVSEALEFDPRDDRHTHALAVDANGIGIATGRLSDDGSIGNIGNIGRMAVLSEWRGRGVGGAILNCLLDAAVARGMTTAALHAQVHARDFYAAHGFAAHGDAFMEAGIAHIAMTRALKNS